MLYPKCTDVVDDEKASPFHKMHKFCFIFTFFLKYIFSFIHIFLVRQATTLYAFSAQRQHS